MIFRFLYQERYDEEKQRKFYLNTLFNKVLWELPDIDFEKGLTQTKELIEQENSEATLSVPSPSSSPRSLPTFSSGSFLDQRSSNSKSMTFVSGSPKDSLFPERLGLSFLGATQKNGSAAPARQQETTEPNGDDEDFSDFANSYVTPETTNQTNKAQMKFEKYSDIPASQNNKSKTMRGTLFLKQNTFIENLTGRQQRGESEATIESNLFTGVGMGNVKVLAACEGVIVGPKKKKENIILAVVRDWSGSYIIVIISNTRTGLSFTGSARSIVKSYSLADSYSIKILETGNSSTVRFDLVVDGDKETFSMNTKMYKKFEKAINFAFGKVHENQQDVEVLNMRLASVDFAESVCPSGFIVDDIQNFLSLAFDTKRISQDDLITLRSMIRKPVNRKVLLQMLCSRLDNLTPTDEKEISMILDLYNETIICPTKCDGGLEQKFKEKLLLLRRNMTQGEIAEKADLLIEQTSLMVSILENWQGRGKLPDIPFPEEFTDPQSENMGRKRMEKESQIIRENMSRYFNGVFFCVLFYTDTHVLIDNYNMLPSERLRCPYSSFASFTADSPEMKWALGLGKHWTEHLYYQEDTSEAAFPTIKSELSKAAKKLQKTFNTDLGILYDRVVNIQNSKMAFIITCRYIGEKSVVNSKDYIWEDRIAFEHRFYQGLRILTHYNERIERLKDTFYGPRFIENVIMYHKQMTLKEKPIDDGLYLCYMRWNWSSTHNIRVLVDENKRMVLPYVKLSKGLIDREKWEWIQSIRLRERLGKPIEQDPQYQVDMNTPIEEYERFEKKFCRALLELKTNLGLNNLGHLYDLEFIPIDMQNRTFFIVFCEQVDEDDFKQEWVNKYIWRSLETFENMNAYCFLELLSHQYKICLSKHYLGMEQGTTQDEILRYQLLNVDKQTNVMRAEKAWVPFRWAQRILHWSMKGSVSVTSSCIDDLNTIREQVQEASKRVSGLNVELKATISALSQKHAQSPFTAWDIIGGTIEKKIIIRKEMETQAIKKDIPPTSDQETNLNDPPKEMELPCTLEALIDIEDVLVPSPFEICSNLVGEIIDISLIQVIDWKEQKVTYDIVEEMISIIESLDMITNAVAVSEEAESYVDLIREEREYYQLNFLSIFEEVTEDSEIDKQSLKDAVFEATASYDGIIRNSVSLFHDAMENALTMLNVSTAALDTFDLAMDIESYEDVLKNGTQIARELFNNNVYTEQVKKEFGIYIDQPQAITDLDENKIQSIIDHGLTEEIRLAEVMKKTADRVKPAATPLFSTVPVISLVEIMGMDDQTIAPLTIKEPVSQTPHFTLISSDNVPFEVPITVEDVEKFKFYLEKAVKGVYHVDFKWDITEVLANYLKSKSLSSFLIHLQESITNQQINLKNLEKLAKEYSNPYIYLICIHNQHLDSYTLIVQLIGSFINHYPISDLCRWESDWEPVPNSAYMFDTLFYIRFKAEFETTVSHCPPFTKYENKWKQIYSEKRVSMFFQDSTHFFQKFYPNQVTKESFKVEIFLWKKFFGKSVKMLNLKHCKSIISEKEVKIISSCFPNLMTIHSSNNMPISEEALHNLRMACPNLKLR